MLRCMEHTVQLSAASFLKTICPNPATFRNRVSTKNGSAYIEDEDEDSEDNDDEDEDSEDNDDDNNDGDADFGDEHDDGPADAAYELEIDNGIEFNPGDMLGKLLACITQVHICILVICSH
jgi:hypothetical protein